MIITPSSSRRSSRGPTIGLRNTHSVERSSFYTPDPETLMLPEAPLSSETTELLQQFVHAHNHDEDTSALDDDDEGHCELDQHSEDTLSLESTAHLPWHKRPSPIWFLIFISLGATAVGGTLAPRIEIFTQIACEVYKPEWMIGQNSDSDSGFEVGTDRRHMCATDPVVLAEVAKLSVIITATFGTLSCLTTAWWGSLSDRYGRTRILTFCIFGMIMTDLSFIIVYHFYKILPGGYWFILVGPVLDGLLGGIIACQAAVQAYFVDCTPPEAHSRLFSLYMGLLFTGTAIGPTLGSIVIRLTGSLLSVFYITAAVHISFAMAVALFVPESLSKQRILGARRSHEAVVRAANQAPKTGDLSSAFRKLFAFLTPLAIFHQGSTGQERRPKKSWNLTLVALSFACMVSLLGTYTSKFQYTGRAFGWTSEEIGYWLSTIGFTGAIYLTLILPVIIKYLKPKAKPPIHLHTPSVEPSSSTTTSRLSHSPERPGDIETDSHVLAFDLTLARVSIILEFISHLLIPLAPNGATFTALTVLGALATGFSPAIQSVAVGLYVQQGGTELGKLFGAWNVVQALSSQVIGPAMYGLTFMWTVATFPSAIFLLAAAVISASFALLSFVRLPRPSVADPQVHDTPSEG